MCPKNLSKLWPGNLSLCWLHSWMTSPPYLCRASQLLRCKGSLVHFCAIKNAKLVLHGANPSICLKRIFGLVEQRWLGGKKTDVVSFCWWCLSTSAALLCTSCLNNSVCSLRSAIRVAIAWAKEGDVGGCAPWPSFPRLAVLLLPICKSTIPWLAIPLSGLIHAIRMCIINMNTQHESFPSWYGSPREQKWFASVKTTSNRVEQQVGNSASYNVAVLRLHNY